MNEFDEDGGVGPAEQPEIPAARTALEERLGHVFRNPGLLETALQHPSFAHEQDGTRGNERLEFLGDAVIDLAAAQLLFAAHPTWEEGHLSRARAALVNTTALARHARDLEIPAHVRLGRTERKGGIEKDSILANVFEAVIGAVYLDAGLGPVVALARELFAAALAPDSDAFAADPKTRFQEWTHAELRKTPRYVAVEDTGVENDEERFAVEARIEGEVWGHGRGRTKRAAERAAAETALERVAAKGDVLSMPKEPAHRAGVVALLGRPNAGKSSLLNRLLGEKLAIVTAKPQTTRGRLLGIVTRPDAQLLLVDTPGFLAGSRPLEMAMQAASEEAAADCDVALLLVAPMPGFEPIHAEWLARLAERRKPVLLVATQCDRPEAGRSVWPPPGVHGHAGALRVSARTGEGIEALVARIVSLLPEAPAFYPADEITDRPLRFLVAEAVREAVFESLAQELPYRMAVDVVDFDESDPALTRIRANLLVERDSQKRIVIGRGGEQIKAIGIHARREIERLLGRQVHLALWVKIDPDWLRKPKRLKSLGYC